MGMRRAAPRVVGWLAVGGMLGLAGQAALEAAQRYPKLKTAMDVTAMIAALSKLEAKQEEVLRRLEETKKELGIIKVRAATIPTGISTSGGSCN